MVIDSSALVAILLEEPDAQRIAHAMRGQAENCHIAAPTLLEAYIVMYGRNREAGVADLDRLRNGKVRLRVQGFHSTLTEIAREAYMRYGKASGHPAGLNFGDCFSYALTKSRNDALLCKGNDFAQTDIQVVAY